MEKCILCTSATKNKEIFCNNCFKIIKKRTKNLMFLNNQHLRNYYFEQKDRYSYFKSNRQLQLLCALALYNNEQFNDNYLINRIKTDINDLIEKIGTEEQLKEHNNTFALKSGDNQIDEFNDEDNNSTELTNFNDYDYRQKWPRDIQCEDGHYVRSKGEKIIDDWLYHHNIVHAYEKSVYMKSNPNDIVLSDFYIPKGDVYIEFWGMNDNPDYEERKRYKISLYDKNNYKRIDLEDTHINRIDDIMPRVLGKYNIE